MPLLAVLAVSCSKELAKEINGSVSKGVEPEKEQVISDLAGKVAVIGEKLRNPYSVESMKEALSQLDAQTRAEISEDDIVATHHYIAFKPEKWEDLEEIRDLGFFLCECPLDYEVSDGIIPLDERFSTNGYRWRWVYVPVSFDLSGVQCPFEIMYDVFSPEDAVDTKSISMSERQFRALEVVSCALSGEQVDPPTKVTRYTPKGFVRFWDPIFKMYRGCKGMSIRSVRGTHTGYVYCDENGFFEVDAHYLHRWDYYIYFSREKFLVNNGDDKDEIMIIKASGKQDLTEIYDQGTNETFYAAITRAACRYYYGDNIGGLRRPVQASENNGKRLTIYAEPKYLIKDGALEHGYTENGLKYRETHIYRDSLGNLPFNFASYAVSTYHELAHTTHSAMTTEISYSNVERKLRETYATAIAWYLSREEDPKDYYVSLMNHLNYHGVFIDLCDGKKKTIVPDNGNLIALPDSVDRLFSVLEIENLVKNKATYDECKEAIKDAARNKPGNSYTNWAKVSNQFSYWNELFYVIPQNE